jgi:group I intron endonuclease
MQFINENYRYNNGVYQIKNLLNNKIYIGSTFRKCGKGFWVRYNQYVKHKQTYFNKKLLNAINKYGLENFIFEVLEVVNTSVKDCRIKEEFYIKKFNAIKNGYNIKLQGTGGNGGANLGKRYPRPSKELIKRRGIGVSKAMKGIKKSLEHCLAISKAKKGCKPSHSLKVKLFDTQTGNILQFNSATEASRALGCTIDPVCSLMNNKSKILLKRYVNYSSNKRMTSGEPCGC